MSNKSTANEITLLIIVAVALGLLGVVEAIIIPSLVAEAGSCHTSIAFNACQGCCLHPS
jgi:hypothetical protein